MAQFADTRNPALPEIPLATEVVTTEKARQAMSFISSSAVLQWPLLAPPGLDPQRVSELRQGFDAMMADAAFLADADQSLLDIAPISGLEMQSVVEALTRTPEDVLSFIRRINEGK